IVHMLLMSWGGQGVDKVDGADVPDLAGETERTLRKAGVVHGDARPANMLWNAERRRVMLIDFDRSVHVAQSESSGLNWSAGTRQRIHVSSLSGFASSSSTLNRIGALN
ncbi:hypothetical protein QBC46DRAFT_274883, partial [Diplogelasinospora grovesii]